MLAAVALGAQLTRLPVQIVRGLTFISFVGIAIAICRVRDHHSTGREVRNESGSLGGRMQGIGVSFCAVFFAEWGDAGQITAAALVARYDAPILVWIAGSAALATKSVLALAVGIGLRRYLDQRMLQIASVMLCILMGIGALLGRG